MEKEISKAASSSFVAIDSICSKIKQELESKGYSLIEEPGNLDIFFRIAQGLGHVVHRSTLEIQEKGDYAILPKRVPFHNDNPDVNTIGWFCVDQDEQDGHSLFIDGSDISDHLSEPQIEILKTLPVVAPDIRTMGEKENECPVLTPKENGFEIYYTPWLLRGNYTDQQREALTQFASYIVSKQREQLIRLRLEPNQMVFIDNRRMFHGRDALPLTSKRHLKRVWISNDPSYEGFFKKREVAREQ